MRVVHIEFGDEAERNEPAGGDDRGARRADHMPELDSVDAVRVQASPLEGGDPCVTA
ncbi:hypothetical protein ABT124_49375 [Streptomyces sp. NPDC001982]|uniref:hypothetical protein n=1 Tax=Streptomyces sp. NPDC001982 TaxID=3154405 RepID=UPI003318F3FA